MNNLESEQKPVPWCSKEEWSTLSDLIRSLPDHENANQTGIAISMLHCLSTRSPQPSRGSLMTSELLQAYLVVAQSAQRQTSKPSQVKLTPHHRQICSFALIRFVNYLAHTLEVPGEERRPVTRVAWRLNVPTWLVSMRHEAAHGAVPPATLLPAAIHSALCWLISEYWRETPARPSSAGDTAASLDQLASQLTGPRGRQLDRKLLTSCLTAPAVSPQALRLVAETMVTSVLQTEASGAPLMATVSSWSTVLTVMMKLRLLTPLLETLLTISGTRHQRHAGAVWAERILRAVAHATNEHAVPLKSRKSPQKADHNAKVWRALLPALTDPPADASVDAKHLLKVALLQRHLHNTHLLPVLLSSLDPPMPEKRCRLLHELVDISSGKKRRLSQSPATPIAPLTFRHLKPFGIQPPPSQLTEDRLAPPAAEVTVAPPPAEAGTAWSRCADEGTWLKSVSPMGRLPWQSDAFSVQGFQSELNSAYAGYEAIDVQS